MEIRMQALPSNTSILRFYTFKMQMLYIIEEALFYGHQEKCTKDVKCSWTQNYEMAEVNNSVFSLAEHFLSKRFII